MKNTIVIIIISILCGCSVKRYNPEVEENFIKPDEQIIVKKIEYDEHGLPNFKNSLAKRPDTEGESFSIIEYRDKKPIKSFDIIVFNRENNTDPTLPIKIIFEWTGKGFKKGVEMWGTFTPGRHISVRSSYRSAEAFPYVASVVIGTAGGFFYGVVESSTVLFKEFEKVVVWKKEVLTGYTLYEYDDSGRLKLMKIYNPNNRQEVMHVDFYYQEKTETPYKTEYSSKPEELIRTIYSDPKFPST